MWARTRTAIVATTIALLLAGAAPTTAPTTGPAALTLDLGHGLHLELVRVPAGRFVMGSPDAEGDRDPSEGPQHTVTIAKPFWIGRIEITQAQWVGVAGPNQSQFKNAPGHDTLPCECVSWTDCQKFCDAASKITGRHVRLPSEAEWEYAARGGSAGAFGVGSGNAISSDIANFNGTSPYGGAPPGPERKTTTPVGSFAPNRFGLCDAVGNVSEWCQDVYHDTYDGAPADGSAWEAGGNPELRVYRGGAYNNDASSCRSAVRFAAERGDVRNSTLGFRVVVDDK
jgi:formylglycine-generating enzyme required for sulfatase activity